MEWSFVYYPERIEVYRCEHLEGSYILITSTSCNECSYPLINREVCLRLGAHSVWLTKIYTMGIYYQYDRKHYDYLSRHIVKAKGSIEIATLLGAAMAGLIVRRDSELLKFDCIVPVPQTYSRLKFDETRNERFNQVEKIANTISKKLKIPVIDALVKTRDDSQRGKGPEEREIAAIDLYRCTPELVKSKTVILVDDVTTSGSTLKECAKELRNSGAREVRAYVCAITYKRFEN